MPAIQPHDPARFAYIPDYPFAEHWQEVDLGNGETARMHYVDEGPRDGPVILLLHGEPSWSFLYRFMIPPLAEAGCRVVAPDLIGFGKSDKPTDKALFSYAAHYDWLVQVLDALELKDVGLFCQDWGGLLGLRAVGLNPDRFAFVVASNTMLPTGKGTPPDAFLAWQQFAKSSPDFRIGPLLQRATVRELSESEVAAYDAPFPDEPSKAAARMFPTLVPTSEDDPGGIANVAAWAGLARFDKPFLTLFTDQDPITKGGEAYFQKMVPGAKGQPHRIVEGGGHFCQEDVPDAFVAALKELAGV
ncbi:haloalkane dehalogenase [Sphingomicrobium sediminis]|uniref:Haloalkane dehalogenase n=1 Tax=Sphingomicrobium sediminis TaxID=2950949 RepID=A0A9X2EMT6_9SPHN|nr:haloalkane dehalogenase [Sphingomicrobium sediminis]MCM8558269.1 haloalkane dehalogenase [Sphingomicrobium sediminis]